jgi:hypothetical protein
MAEFSAKNRANWQKTHLQHHQNRVGTRFEDSTSRSATLTLRENLKKLRSANKMQRRQNKKNN